MMASPSAKPEVGFSVLDTAKLLRIATKLQQSAKDELDELKIINETILSSDRDQFSGLWDADEYLRSTVQYVKLVKEFHINYQASLKVFELVDIKDDMCFKQLPAVEELRIVITTRASWLKDIKFYEDLLRDRTMQMKALETFRRVVFDFKFIETNALVSKFGLNMDEADENGIQGLKSINLDEPADSATANPDLQNALTLNEPSEQLLTDQEDFEDMDDDADWTYVDDTVEGSNDQRMGREASARESRYREAIIELATITTGIANMAVAAGPQAPLLVPLTLWNWWTENED